MNIVLPKIETEASSQNFGRFVIKPLESGYGITLGNALRRVLLSSLEGAAVTSVRLSGVHHEFSDIPHVREDTIEFVLNVKQLRMKLHGEGPARLHAEITAEGPVTGADLRCPPEVEIVTPDLYLFTTDSNDVELDVEMVVHRGRGYSPAEDRGKLPLGEIPVDAIFSPIRRANYRVERMRVGQDTDYDRLVMEVWTDGTMSPDSALRDAARILVQHLTLISGVEAAAPEAEEPEEERIPGRVYDAPIEELELTVRAYNCLKRAGITKVGEILERLEQGEDEMLSIRNFGRKSLDELVERLEERGYLSMIEYDGTPGEGDYADDELEEEDEFEDDQEDQSEEIQAVG